MEKMICLLCFGIERDEQLIDIVSEDSRQLNIASILHTHFGFCFKEQPKEGWVCQKCWVKVSIFHDFYIQIECVHRSNESIFAECIGKESKHTRDAACDNNNWEFPAKNGETKLEKPRKAITRKKRKRRKSESDDLNDSSTDKSRYFEINSDEVSTHGIELETDGHQMLSRSTKKKGKPEGRPREDKRIIRSEKDEPLKDDIPLELNINNEPKRKRGRPRKDDPVKPRSTKCTRCPLKFTSFSALSRHIKQVHIILPFRCKQSRCVESFATQQDRDIHFDATHKQTKCPHCNKMIIESTIGQHIRTQHEPKNDQIMCDLCGKISSTISKHKAHYRKIHETHSKVQCDICKEWTKHKESLRRHMIRKHIYGPQTCTVCGHTSPNRNALREHSKKHRPDFKTRFKCLHCDRGFRNRMSLVEHSHIHTGFAGQYRCDDCGKIFRFNSSFYIHRKKMHPK